MKTILLISPYWKEEHRWMVSTVKLAELWQRLGYRVVVMCMGKAVKSEKCKVKNGMMAEAVSETLEIYRVKDFFLPDPWNYGIAFGFGGRAMALARDLKPDVIVVNKVLFWSSISLLGLHFAGYPVLLLTDALVGITWWPRSKIATICAWIYANTLGWFILMCATKIVFFHPQPESVLKRLGVDEKSLVIPTGIDPAPYRIPSARDPKKVNVTYVGRLESVKGVDDFVAAAVKVKREHPELHVRVVGWYELGHLLVDNYKNEVEFTGLRSDIPAVLSETDIFVLPSYSEGLSNALMEAMSAGCACIASDVGGNAFLLQNGVSGFLFPAGDREALASHIRRLVTDSAKRTALGEKAKERIDNMFSWEKVGAEYRKVFEGWTRSEVR